ncbi:Uncharacterised protein [Moraxella caprae]|uniref:Uncharacterized protein n=1 Tax=Moraxella caprae TaxID=90240 RepID=A0A378R2N5_9GAMM|nr:MULTISPECIES: hypothetical protein [Moraxella]STZ08120.1 Uncharacterised protein [Moraxella caprae]
MKTLTLTAENHIVDSILAVIANFPKKEIISVKTNVQDELQPLPEVNSIEDLAGILSPYTNGYISDEEMDNAITDAICERAMMS